MRRKGLRGVMICLRRDRRTELPMPALLDRETIEKAFRLMGRYLLDRKVLGKSRSTAAARSCFSSIGGAPRGTSMRE